MNDLRVVYTRDGSGSGFLYLDLRPWKNHNKC